LDGVVDLDGYSMVVQENVNGKDDVDWPPRKVDATKARRVLLGDAYIPVAALGTWGKWLTSWF
jgi:hypothetical protein